MNYPTPAIVTQRQVRRLPRLALLLMCAAYILPGVFGRDPWRTDDITAFGYMNAIAEGATSWLKPELLGNEPSGGLIPYWLGAVFIKALPFLNAPFAARIPFALLLAAIFAFTWYACYYLARTEPAQPISFAFGGEARPNDYARAIADGSLLALMASLGLLQPGHETTPELMQMWGFAFFFFCLAAAPFKTWGIRLCAVLSIALLSLSGAPLSAIALGVIATVMCSNSEYNNARKAAPYFTLGILVSILLLYLTKQWESIYIHIDAPGKLLLEFLKNIVWFSWPTWPLMLWSLWSWRYLWRRRHISAPLVIIVVSISGFFFRNGDKNYLLYMLPAMAVLAAFAMPTLKRSISALVDWFALTIFTLLMLLGWFYWFASITGIPAQQAQRVLRLTPGFEYSFSLLPFTIALVATCGWLLLVRWRTGRHRPAIWKGMVLSAGGVTLCWLMMMTLGLNAINYARSFKPWSTRIETVLMADTGTLPPCISTQYLSTMQIAAWSWELGTPLKTEKENCPYLIVDSPTQQYIPIVDHQRWELHNDGVILRPSDRSLKDRILIYRLRQGLDDQAQ